MADYLSNFRCRQGVPPFNALVRSEFRMRNLASRIYRTVILNRLSVTHERDRRTDGHLRTDRRTDILIASAALSYVTTTRKMPVCNDYKSYKLSLTTYSWMVRNGAHNNRHLAVSSAYFETSQPTAFTWTGDRVSSKLLHYARRVVNNLVFTTLSGSHLC